MPALRSGGSRVATAARRAIDLAAFPRKARAYDFLHVHYGSFAYYAWLARRPYFLHIHGSDIWLNLKQPGYRQLVLRGMRQALGVAFSTPNLAEPVHEIRPDALWVPAPVDVALFAPPVTNSAAKRPTQQAVFFFTRWDANKGLEDLLRTATELRRARPELRLRGVDQGVGTEAARAAGLELLPPIAHDALPAVLRQHDVVVGQLASGALGRAELEAMALGLLVVARFDYSAAYDVPPPVLNVTGPNIGQRAAEAVLDVLDRPSEYGAEAAQGPAWVAQRHAPDVAVELICDLYAAALGRR